MAGKYRSVQTLIRERSPLAFYIPCFGHSLNLVGINAVDSVPKALDFFGFIQNVYTFLSASTHHWSILKDYLEGDLVVKNLS